MPAYAFDGVVPVVDPTAFVHDTASLIGDVIVGPGCYIGPFASLRGDFGRIVVGEGSNVQDSCVIHAFPGADAVLEPNSHIGHGAVLHGCRIGSFALIGIGATVLDGAELIIDELGYLPLPGEAASALFQVINQRYLKTSIVLTTNRPVGAWGEILGDTTVAAAMLDRLLHRSVVVTLEGASYRLRNHRAAADELRRVTTGTNLR